MNNYAHRKVNHNIGEYVNGDVHKQTIESFWAILKRAHKGVYHVWSDKHFDLYLREFALRWKLRRLSEGDRIDVFLRHVNGTRLSYEDLKNGQRQAIRGNGWRRTGQAPTGRPTAKGARDGDREESKGVSEEAYDCFLTAVLMTPPHTLPHVPKMPETEKEE